MQEVNIIFAHACYMCVFVLDVFGILFFSLHFGFVLGKRFIVRPGHLAKFFCKCSIVLFCAVLMVICSDSPGDSHRFV